MENRWTEIPLILLAGGRSRRMGTPKGLLRLGGVTWIRHQLGSFLKIGGKEVVIVLGFNAEAYLRELETPGGHGGAVVINSRPEDGPFSSLQQGLRYFLEKNSALNGVFVLPIDVPCPVSAVWSALASAANARVSACIPTLLGRGGHPVWISAGLAENNLSLPATHRLDFVLKSLPAEQVCRVEVADPRVRVNLNDRRAWKKYCYSLFSGSPGLSLNGRQAPFR